MDQEQMGLKRNWYGTRTAIGAWLITLSACAPVITSPTDFHIAPGFCLDIIAASPMVQDPVAAVYGPDGVLWVVEMRGYMQDADGSGETAPCGAIKQLFDLSGDGVMDSAAIFLDSLVLPRAVCPVGKGVLVALPPALWFIDMKDGKPGRRTLVDSLYADGGNVEHQANGLYRSLDNWIYSAKSDKRYRCEQGNWIIDTTFFRGQWGISADDYGRLCYNNNSVLLQSDICPPEVMAAESNLPQDLVHSLYGQVIGSQEVFPIVKTPGVNRGYEKGVLRADSTLSHATAACSPVIYRGDQYPAAFRGDAFIMEPAGMLIAHKSVEQQHDGHIVEDSLRSLRTFIGSHDERFRPVNACHAPDGTLSVIDFHRGVIQHTTYMTPWLRRQVKARQLEQPIGQGRIYRIRYEEKPLSPVVRPDTLSPDRLVSLLRHQNGWYRDKAQQLIIDRQWKEAMTYLEPLLSGNDPLAALHAAWTLEGLHVLEFRHLKSLLEHHPTFPIVMHVLLLARTALPAKEAMEIIRLSDKFLEQASDIRTYISLSTLSFVEARQSFPVCPLTEAYMTRHPQDTMAARVIKAAWASAISAREEEPDFSHMPALYQKVLQEKQHIKTNSNLVFPATWTTAQRENWHAGRGNYATYCASCHGQSGDGIAQLAPPLAGSEWVAHADVDIPMRIVLDGLTGPVIVQGKRYQLSNMPGLRENISVNDGVIASILTYIRYSWGNQSSPVSVAEVAALRRLTATRSFPYTIDELTKKER